MKLEVINTRVLARDLRKYELDSTVGALDRCRPRRDKNFYPMLKLTFIITIFIQDSFGLPSRYPANKYTIMGQRGISTAAIKNHHATGVATRAIFAFKYSYYFNSIRK